MKERALSRKGEKGSATEPGVHGGEEYQLGLGLGPGSLWGRAEGLQLDGFLDMPIPAWLFGCWKPWLVSESKYQLPRRCCVACVWGGLQLRSHWAPGWTAWATIRCSGKEHTLSQQVTARSCVSHNREGPALPSSQELLIFREVGYFCTHKWMNYFVALLNCTLEFGRTKSSFDVYLGTGTAQSFNKHLLTACASGAMWVQKRRGPHPLANTLGDGHNVYSSNAT